MQVRSLHLLSELRIQHCHELWSSLQAWLRYCVAVAVAGSYSSDSTPSLGTSICHRSGPRNSNNNNNNKKKTKDQKKKKKKRLILELRQGRYKMGFGVSANVFCEYGQFPADPLMGYLLETSIYSSLLLAHFLSLFLFSFFFFFGLLYF